MHTFICAAKLMEKKKINKDLAVNELISCLNLKKSA